MTTELVLLYLTGSLLTVVAGISAGLAALRHRRGVPHWFVVTILSSPVYLLVLQFLKLYANRNYADFAAWNEILYKIIQGEGAVSSVQGAFVSNGASVTHWFSAHFTPIVYPLAAVYWLAPRPESLIVTQWILMITTVGVTFVYAHLRTGSRDAALIVACVICLYPTFQYIMLYEFEALRFAIPLLIAVFVFLESGRVKAFYVCLGLALLVREEVALTTGLLGLYLAAFVPRHRHTGLVVVGISTAYFAIVFWGVMPSFRSGGQSAHVAASWFPSLGEVPGEILRTVITDPMIILGPILQPVKLANLFLYALPLGFLPALTPVTLIALGNAGLNLLSAAYTHTSYFLYYLSPTVAILVVGSVDAIPRAARLIERRCSGIAPEDSRRAVLQGLLACALAGNLFFGPSPLSLQFWFRSYRLAPFRTHDFHYTSYRVTGRDLQLREVLRVVPKDAVVSCEQHILPLLYDRKGLLVFPELRGATYVVIDRQRREKTGVASVPGSWDGLRQNPQHYYNWVELDPGWEQVLATDGFEVYASTDTRTSAASLEQ